MVPRRKHKERESFLCPVDIAVSGTSTAILLRMAKDEANAQGKTEATRCARAERGPLLPWIPPFLSQGEIKFLIAKPVSLRVLLLTLNTSLLTYESPVTWGNDQIAARSKSMKKQTLSRVLLYIF